MGDYFEPPSGEYSLERVNHTPRGIEFVPPNVEDYNLTPHAPPYDEATGDYPVDGEYSDQEDEEEEEEEEQPPAFPPEPSMLRIVLHHCLTNGGLIIFLIAYTCMGAVVFQRLEGPAEENAVETTRLERLDHRNLFLRKMKNISHWADVDESQWWRRASRHLKGYEDELDVVVLRDKEKFQSSWNFYGSMFFATTILTTIGYGNIAPVTPGGRVFCMVYAVFGIALLLLVLASIGTLLARGATLTYRRMHTMIQAARGEGPEEKTYQRDRRSQEIIDEIWKPPADKQADGDAPIHVVELEGKGKNGESGGTARKRRTKEEEEEPPAPEEPQIPLFIVLVFAFLYICFLALLLRVWEDQWDYFEAFYFSFITLTTIGFGDLVPIHQKNLLGCTFFILLGMAIMSMCIALAQELIIQKVSWLSKKIGVAFANKRKGSADEESS
ncbi:TWiK family of potassium channels protein 7-like isoform X1 [Diadema antillarum]|uniref:TWiK family of potassium channels protein 7-like isoform X1 n=1 Tax=Diadema antillarum TaxID=105358 RepID=UPI003A878E7F